MVNGTARDGSAVEGGNGMVYKLSPWAFSSNDTWKSMWMHEDAGKSKGYATGPMHCRIIKGPK